MKHTNVLGFLAVGILAVLLSGCFNPIAVESPQLVNPTDSSVVDDGSFTITVPIGPNAWERSITGPSAVWIKDGELRNFIQLIVVEMGTDKIVDVVEDFREDKGDEFADLILNTLSAGTSYDFLILMGHWERDTDREADEKYRYKGGSLLSWLPD